MHDELQDPAEFMAAIIKRKHGRSPNILVPSNQTVNVGKIRSSLKPVEIIQDDAPIDGGGLYNALISKMPYDVQASFTNEQVRAIRQAATQLRWGQHPVDVRVTIPWPGKRYYVAFLAGTDRRSAKRNELTLTPYRCLQLAGLAGLLVLAGLMVADFLPASAALADLPQSSNHSQSVD